MSRERVMPTFSSSSSSCSTSSDDDDDKVTPRKCKASAKKNNTKNKSIQTSKSKRGRLTEDRSNQNVVVTPDENLEPLSGCSTTPRRDVTSNKRKCNVKKQLALSLASSSDQSRKC